MITVEFPGPPPPSIFPVWTDNTGLPGAGNMGEPLRPTGTDVGLLWLVEGLPTPGISSVLTDSNGLPGADNPCSSEIKGERLRLSDIVVRLPRLLGGVITVLPVIVVCPLSYNNKQNFNTKLLMMFVFLTE